MKWNKRKPDLKVRFQFVRHKIDSDEIIMFAEKLRTRLIAGKSIGRALKLIAEDQAIGKPFAEMIHEAIALKKDCQSFARALGQAFFPKMFIMLFAVSEFKNSNKTLIKALAEFVAFEKKRRSLQQKKQ